jgi:hypothetical protein
MFLDYKRDQCNVICIYFCFINLLMLRISPCILIYILCNVSVDFVLLFIYCWIISFKKHKYNSYWSSKFLKAQCALMLSFLFIKNCLFLVSCYSFQKHTHLRYTWTVMCIFSSVGIGISKVNKQFVLKLKYYFVYIVLSLHIQRYFCTFKTCNMHFIHYLNINVWHF